jgi:hypothetical protein
MSPSMLTAEIVGVLNGVTVLPANRWRREAAKGPVPPKREWPVFGREPFYPAPIYHGAGSDPQSPFPPLPGTWPE